MGWARDLSHMKEEQFQKFIEQFEYALKMSDLVPCNEAEELQLRSFASYIWEAGINWQDTHSTIT